MARYDAEWKATARNYNNDAANQIVRERIAARMAREREQLLQPVDSWEDF